MRKFEIGQNLGVRFADPDSRSGAVPGTSGSQLDARSDTWSTEVYQSDSEPAPEQETQAERLQEIAEDPAEHIRYKC